MEDSHNILSQVALSFVGVVDKATIDTFRRTVTGQAVDQNWCLDFVWYCLNKVNAEHQFPALLPTTELVANLWDHSPARQRSVEPHKGYIAVWNKLGGIHGHCGIVTDFVPGAFYFRTVEGNTAKPFPPNTIGVWQKTRYVEPLRKPVPGDFVLKGFLNPFI